MKDLLNTKRHSGFLFFFIFLLCQDGIFSQTKVNTHFDLVSNFIWRGESFGGEKNAVRNQQSYKSYQEHYAIQPLIEISSGESGFKTFFWGNFNLTDRNDTSKTSYDGMKRKDGIFTSLSYTFLPSELGTFTVGFWIYNPLYSSLEQTVNNTPARYSWHEVYVFWMLPFLEKLRPTVSLYTQTSSEMNGLYSGKNYLSFHWNYPIYQDGPIQFIFSNSTGYTRTNNNIENRSGFQDISSKFDFGFDWFHIMINHVYRPDLRMYDSPYSYPATSGGFENFRDGRVTDPSLNSIYQAEIYPRTISGLPLTESEKKIIQYEFTSQNIPRNLFWFGLGAKTSF